MSATDQHFPTVAVDVWCIGEDRLAYYDLVKPSAWIAAEQPLDLRDWA